MLDHEIAMPPVSDAPLTVDLIGDEIVVDGFTSAAASLSMEAARETARLLMVAVETLEARRRSRY
ncbi:hypothetical protein KX816_07365 [Sphingosinicellaceae bacterium]|nr:hypothetical protein KX816_07365 [Sphingosinicellaceae bacterium]